MSDKTTIYISSAAAAGLRRQALERGFTTRYGGEERASVSGLIEAIGLGKLKITKGDEDEMEKTITMTAERLMALSDNGMALYWTPGSEAPYWASQPSFRDDVCVATVRDFVKAVGFDDLEGFEDNEPFTLVVKRPSSQSIRITEEHLGSDATREQAERMIELLRERGWDAAYGEGRTPDDDPQFQADWDAALDVISRESY